MKTTSSEYLKPALVDKMRERLGINEDISPEIDFFNATFDKICKLKSKNESTLDFNCDENNGEKRISEVDDNGKRMWEVKLTKSGKLVYHNIDKDDFQEISI